MLRNAFRADGLAHIESDGDQEKEVEADHAKPHPKRPVRIDERDQNLPDGERQVLIQGEHNHMQQDKTQSRRNASNAWKS